MTRDEALAALVEQEVRRWNDEGEREAATRLHGRKSLGLMLNTLASNAKLFEGEAWLGPHTDGKALRKLANAALTPADKAELRKGG